MRDEELRRLFRSLAEPMANGVEPPEPRLVRARGRRRRRRLLAGTAFVLAVALAGAGGAWAGLARRPDPPLTGVSPASSAPAPPTTAPAPSAPATTSSTPASPSTTSSAPASPTTTLPPGPIELGFDGLGVARFGSSEQATMAALLHYLGQPDRDSGWQQGQLLGVCPGEHTRVVRWDLLVVAFTDGPSTYGPRGKRHLFYWSFQKPASLGGNQRRLDLLSKIQLPDGISARSTVNDLRATFGADHVRIAPGIEPQPANGRLTITGPAGALSKLYGLLSDAQPTGTSTWYSLKAGQICGE